MTIIFHMYFPLFLRMFCSQDNIPRITANSSHLSVLLFRESPMPHTLMLTNSTTTVVDDRLYRCVFILFSHPDKINNRIIKTRRK